MSFRTIGPNILEITYATAEDMAPENQSALKTTLERLTRNARLALCFQVGRLPKVDAAVPMFWLEITKVLSPNLCAMAILSDSIAVRSAARGFGVANALRSVAVEVKAWAPAQTDEALTWLREIAASAAV